MVISLSKPLPCLLVIPFILFCSLVPLLSIQVHAQTTGSTTTITDPSQITNLQQAIAYCQSVQYIPTQCQQLKAYLSSLPVSATPTTPTIPTIPTIPTTPTTPTIPTTPTVPTIPTTPTTPTTPGEANGLITEPNTDPTTVGEATQPCPDPTEQVPYADYVSYLQQCLQQNLQLTAAQQQVLEQASSSPQSTAQKSGSQYSVQTILILVGVGAFALLLLIGGVKCWMSQNAKKRKLREEAAAMPSRPLPRLDQMTRATQQQTYGGYYTSPTGRMNSRAPYYNPMRMTYP